MNVVFTPGAWEDYVWLQTNDRKLLKRANELHKSAMRTPEEGIGKPERLKADLTGCWSRRINDEHRLIYKVSDDSIIVLACRYHYG